MLSAQAHPLANKTLGSQRAPATLLTPSHPHHHQPQFLPGQRKPPSSRHLENWVYKAQSKSSEHLHFKTSLRMSPLRVPLQSILVEEQALLALLRLQGILYFCGRTEEHQNRDPRPFMLTQSILPASSQSYRSKKKRRAVVLLAPPLSMVGRPTGILHCNTMILWCDVSSMCSDLFTSRNAQRPTLIPRPKEHDPGNEPTQEFVH